jgi:hypothetical protein
VSSSPAVSSDRPVQVATPPVKKHAWYVGKVFLGYSFPAWLRLLVRNRFRVSPWLLHDAALATVVSAGNSLVALAEDLVWGRAAARTRIENPPVFILGHWRTGTTLLHELLILDPDHSYPNNYHCTSPNHFLLSEIIAQRYFGFMVPRERPMDSMSLNWATPQEDEFALAAMGIPTPYWTVAFPNHPPQAQEYFDLENVSPEERERWKRAFGWFVRRLTLHDPRRLVFKSPPHTCRIPILLEMFPEARFVHIVRDPYVVFSSTVHLWRSLYTTQNLQIPKLEGIEEYVFNTFSHMYERLEATRHLVPQGRFFEVRYEDLVADPLANMRRLYESLDLGDFERVRPRIERYVAEKHGYKTNRYKLDPALRDEIGRRWGRRIAQYGYGDAIVPAPH